MEDMARLALVEQNVRDTEKFTKLLFELLRLISSILENPHDYELRNVKSALLKSNLDNEAFSDYLKYIGFQVKNNDMSYPKEQTLSRLRIAQAALERKIGFCCGRPGPQGTQRPSCSPVGVKKPKLTPVNILTTKNPLLLKIESLFNNMVRYEDENLQQKARELIPLEALQLAALARVREHQRGIKTGEVKSHDLPFDIALLMELLGWFKNKFFKWVDKPECGRCGGATKYVASKSMRTPTETCTVEVYQCSECPSGGSEFPRYNSPGTLLRTRRGRCGEWANAFTLLCRALGYDTRYVYDTTDHVWCEVYDYDSKTWLHVDPCEAKLNAPLIYSQGWGKKLSYVIAVSRDDLQDVTWRYTSDHKQVLKRRNLCSEKELIQGILTLRERRQRQVSEARRRYLARRAVEELVQLMVERTASSYECHGRISGSAAWVSGRGEGGEARAHEFIFHGAGQAGVRYCCASDEYTITDPGGKHPGAESTLRTWSAGAYAAKGVFRKVETDWQKAYIAREEGRETGFVSWAVRCGAGHLFSAARLWALHEVFQGATVRWTVSFDKQTPDPVDLGESPVHYSRRFKSLEVLAELSGGSGPEAWQHAQLFRQDLAAAGTRRPALDLRLTLEEDHDH